jgi:DNA-binding IclR family transcriptional regulator
MLPRQPNNSVIDGFRCLQHVVTQEKPVGVSQIAADLGMELTRVHRLLRTLSHLGMILQTDSRKYAPGPAISVIAAQTLHATRFGEFTKPGNRANDFVKIRDVDSQRADRLFRTTCI